MELITSAPVEITEWDAKTHNTFKLVVMKKAEEDSYIAFFDNAKLDDEHVYGLGNTPDNAVIGLCKEASGKRLVVITNNWTARVPELCHTKKVAEVVS